MLKVGHSPTAIPQFLFGHFYTSAWKRKSILGQGSLSESGAFQPDMNIREGHATFAELMPIKRQLSTMSISEAALPLSANRRRSRWSTNGRALLSDGLGD